MRIINITLTLLFILFAVVQYNDPDPWMWIALYGFVAATSGFAVFGKYNRTILVLGMIICIIGIGILIPEFIDWMNKGAPSITGSMKAESPHIEFVREFLGLGITFGVLFFHWKKSNQSNLK